MAIAIISGVLTVLFYEIWMDWNAFSHDWSGWSLVAKPQKTTMPTDIWTAGFQIISQIGTILGRISLKKFIPFTDYGRIIFFTENLIFMVYAVSFLFRDIRKNRMLAAMNLYIIYTIYIYLYRFVMTNNQSGFHYLFPLIALCCIQVSYVIHESAKKLKSGDKYKSAIPALILVFIIHVNSFFWGFNAQRIRIDQGKKALAVYSALNSLPPGGKLNRTNRQHLRMTGILTGHSYNTGDTSFIEKEVSSMIKDTLE